MQTTVKIVHIRNGVKSITRMVYPTKELAQDMADAYNGVHAYFIDDNNEAYAYI